MKSTQALNEFNSYLQKNGHTGAPKSPAEGFAQMLGFYKTVRASDVDLEADGDMLLFQWGTSGKGKDAQFELDLVRQFMQEDGEDDGIWQLHLTYRFPVSSALRKLGNGDRWCAEPSELAEFERFVTGHPAIAAVGSGEDGQSEIRYECAG